MCCRIGVVVEMFLTVFYVKCFMLRYAKEYYCINDYSAILLARFDTKAFFKDHLYLSHLLSINFDIKDMETFHA